MAETHRNQTAVLHRVPVAFLIFNRPQFTARVFDAIARVEPSRLLVVGDGPRSDHPRDERLVREARAVIERVDWPCEVLTCYSDVNLGCKRRCTSGLDWVFSQVDEAIILEDDCLPEPTFFPYCEQLLDRYRDDERMQMVSGSSGLYPERFTSHSYYFSRIYHIWGWATWARAWRHYDIEMRRWPELRETRWLEDHLKGEAQAQLARQIFDLTHSEDIDVWDFQWVFTGWLNDGLSVVPSVNLISNIGYGESATHEHHLRHPQANRPTRPIAFPLDHPPEVEVLEEADRAEWALAYPDHFQRKRFPRRLIGALRRMPTRLRTRTVTR